MGNAQLAPKADNNNFHITESFLRDFQKHVSLVDHAVTGLARGIDIMTLTCKRSLQQGDVDVSNKIGLLSTDRLESNVLNTINEHVAENKAIMIDAVRNCLNFIVETFTCYIEVTDNSQTDLAVNQYDTDKWDCEQDFRKLSVESLKKEVAFCMKQCDLQKQEIHILKKKEELYIQQIGQLQIQCQSPGMITVAVQTESEDAVNLLQNLNTMRTVTKNTGRLRKNKNDKAKGHSDCENRMVIETGKDDTIDIKHTSGRKATSVENEEVETTDNGTTSGPNLSQVLNVPKQPLMRENQKVKTVNIATQTCEDKSITNFPKNKASSAETEILVKEIEEHKNTIESLNLQIQMMKHMKTVRVQLYSPLTFSAETAELEVMTLVSTKLKYRSIELIISRCIPKTCLVDTPLLISRDSTDFSKYLFRKKPTIVQTVVKDFKGILEPNQIAAVVFYRMKESELHSEIEQSNDEGLGLGGVFRVGMNSKSIYRSNLNDIAVDSIVEFILTAGVLTQKFDDTPV